MGLWNCWTAGADLEHWYRTSVSFRHEPEPLPWSNGNLHWMGSQWRTRLLRDGFLVTLSLAALLTMELDLDPGRLQAGRRAIVAVHALLRSV